MTIILHQQPQWVTPQQLQTVLDNHQRIVVLAGAGLSTASGIPDFRSATGLWATVNPAEVAHIDVLRENPQRFWEFYRQRFVGMEHHQPNSAHIALQRLYMAGRISGFITQNVDGLQQQAGTPNSAVHEIHGRLDDCRCINCLRTWNWVTMQAQWQDGVPTCDCGGIIRPGIVLFGEMLPQDAAANAIQLVEDSDCMLALGSSLRVAPASHFAAQMLADDKPVYIVNNDETALDRVATGVCRADLGILDTIIA